MTTKKTIKDQVIARLIKSGNNVDDVNEMVAEHFEYAVSKYNTISSIAECIRIVY